jgi:hypothetical protein
MKTFFIIFLFSVMSVYAQEKSDSIKTPLKVNGVLDVTNNGISPVPAFSLGKPALTANFYIHKKRFSYDPDFGVGLNGMPWYIDNWVRYKLILRSRFNLGTGINGNLFFTEYKTPEGIILQAKRYLVFEMIGTYKISKKATISLLYWYANGFDLWTIKGHFIDIIANWHNIPVSKCFLLALNSQFFYTNNTGNNDGLFITGKASVSTRHLPISVYIQGIQAIESNMIPYPGLKWNFGLTSTF